MPCGCESPVQLPPRLAELRAEYALLSNFIPGNQKKSSVNYAVWINKPVVASVELDFNFPPKIIALDATVLV